MISVLIVDDHATVRESVVDLLGWTADLMVVGEAADGVDALDLASELRPDVVLMDASMPNMSGFEATHVLAHRRVRVLMFSSDMHGSVVQSARDAGAIGFVSKRATGGDVVRAIRAAHAGQATWPVFA